MCQDCAELHAKMLLVGLVTLAVPTAGLGCWLGSQAAAFGIVSGAVAVGINLPSADEVRGWAAAAATAGVDLADWVASAVKAHSRTAPAHAQQQPVAYDAPASDAADKAKAEDEDGFVLL